MEDLLMVAVPGCVIYCTLCRNEVGFGKGGGNFYWNSPSKSFLRFKKCGSKSETDLEFLFSLREGLEKKGWK